jgi:hypothetical protein
LNEKTDGKKYANCNPNRQVCKLVEELTGKSGSGILEFLRNLTGEQGAPAGTKHSGQLWFHENSDEVVSPQKIKQAGRPVETRTVCFFLCPDNGY